MVDEDFDFKLKHRKPSEHPSYSKIPKMDDIDAFN